MKILISLDSPDPPAGYVQLVIDDDPIAQRERAAGIDFAGWLGLLRVLDDVLGSDGECPTPVE